MPLSSNTLIHLTREKSSLQGILRENFHVSYCRESIKLAGMNFDARIPMVSFCDIPLSEIKEHISKYGNYGIGLTKEWAQRSGLNPVLYMEPASLLARSYITAFQSFVMDNKTEDFGKDQQSMVDVIRYIKNYQGELTRKGTTISNYRFSDEREWRYVPELDSDCEMIISEKDYLVKKEEIDKAVKSLHLKFTPNDIKYIIIKSDDEIEEFIGLLRAAKGKNFLFHDIERLTTRLLTSDQIHCDV